MKAGGRAVNNPPNLKGQNWSKASIIVKPSITFEKCSRLNSSSPPPTAFAPPPWGQSFEWMSECLFTQRDDEVAWEIYEKFADGKLTRWGAVGDRVRAIQPALYFFREKEKNKNAIPHRNRLNSPHYFISLRTSANKEHFWTFKEKNNNMKSCNNKKTTEFPIANSGDGLDEKGNRFIFMVFMMQRNRGWKCQTNGRKVIVWFIAPFFCKWKL